MIYADEILIKKAIPFILYSATMDSTSFNTALSVGVQGFFLKPNSMKELYDILQTILNYMKDAMGNTDFSRFSKIA